jgi:hypothetical protein
MRWFGTEAAARLFNEISSFNNQENVHSTAGSSIILWCVAVLGATVSLREGELLSQHPHDDRAAAWHVFTVDDLDSSEECPDSPVGEPSNNPVGDVGFSHVDDGTCQGVGGLGGLGKRLKVA